jgi:hypothetical protein
MAHRGDAPPPGFDDFRAACLRGGLADAQLLAERFGFTAEEALAEDGHALELACNAGHLSIVKWFIEWAVLSHADVGAAHLLASACSFGSLEVAQWLTERLELTGENARADYNKALRHACANGHLAVAVWLADRFELTADDARSWGGYALCQARISGHANVVNWLTNHFYPL